MTGPLFTGVGVALVTLFDDDGELDAKATAEHAATLVELGLRAVVVAGSTGEAASLTEAERSALLEEVRFDRQAVTSLDWASYPILRFSDVPDEIAISLIDRRDQPSLGAGEPATSPVFAAVANAIFDATGARLRSIPFTPERVRAALA